MDTEGRNNVEQLLRQARLGVPDCLGRLLLNYGNYMKLLVGIHLDEKLQARCSPSDIVQETYCEAHRDFGQFQGETEEEFFAWLKAILVNNVSRQIEKHVLAAKRDVRREVSLDAMRQALDRSALKLESVFIDRSPSPGTNIRNRERAILLADLLATLPSDYRKVLVLRHCEGLPFKEVAQRMERSTGAVRMLWLRAMDEVREQLGERGVL